MQLNFKPRILITVTFFSIFILTYSDGIVALLSNLTADTHANIL